MIHFAIYSVNEMIILKIFALKKKEKERCILPGESCTGPHGVNPTRSDLEVIQGRKQSTEARAGRACRRHSEPGGSLLCRVFTMFSHPQEKKEKSCPFILFSTLLCCWKFETH